EQLSTIGFGVLHGSSPTGRSPYQRLGQRMQDITGDRGVLKEVIRAGAGEIVPQDASVLVNVSAHIHFTTLTFTPRLQAVSKISKGVCTSL
uniref:Uncharacterized protein n=1 Tax=Chrysemys picta bellii TaxID=8478 RepID=A0A8C3H6R2_CHRPI